MAQQAEELKTPCLFCGSEDKIEWHHWNPLDKVVGIAGANSYELMHKEIKKCWCLCEDCHTKLHQRLVDPLPHLYGVPGEEVSQPS